MKRFLDVDRAPGKFLQTSNMSEEIPVIPKVGSLIVHTGNIVNWNRLKRKPSQTPNEELAECVEATLHEYFSGADKNQLQASTEINYTHKKFKEPLPKEERGDLKLSVKVFLGNSHEPHFINDAISKVCSEMDTTFVESALLAFPEKEGDEELTLEDIQPYWRVLEELVAEETIVFIGIADLDKKLLEELCNWAKVKPMINQVNLALCCVMPEDLKDFAQKNDIQLLTHTDPKDMLTSKALNSVMTKSCTEKDGEGWEPEWALRYSVLIKCRGIIKTKGYIIKATRDTKRRK